MAEKFGLHFGALCKPINEQLNEQGFEIKNTDDLDRFERLSHAITILYVSQIITEVEAQKARKRFMKIITDVVRPISGVVINEH